MANLSLSLSGDSINVKVDSLSEVHSIIKSLTSSLGNLKTTMDTLGPVIEQYSEDKYKELKRHFGYANGDLDKAKNAAQAMDSYLDDVVTLYYNAARISEKVSNLAAEIKAPTLPNVKNIDRPGFHAAVSAFSASGSAGDRHTGGYISGEISFLNAYAYGSANVNKETSSASFAFGAGVSFAQGSVEFGYKDYINASANFELYSAKLSAAGEVGLYSYNENGEVVFDPRIEGELKASAAAFMGAADLKLGNEYLNVKFAGEASAYVASAVLSGSLSKKGAYADFGAVAYAYKVEGNYAVSVCDFPIGASYGVTVGSIGLKTELGIGFTDKAWKIDIEGALGVGVELSITLPNPIMVAYDVGTAIIDGAKNFFSGW